MSRHNTKERNDVPKVESIITGLGWIFRKQAIADVGVDATIEQVIDGKPTGKLIAVQIKLSTGYFKNHKVRYVSSRFEKNHYDYWSGLGVPIIVVVYDPDGETAYWEPISRDGVRQTGQSYVIKMDGLSVLDSKALEAFSDSIARSQRETPVHVNGEDNKIYLTQIKEYENLMKGAADLASRLLFSTQLNETRKKYEAYKQCVEQLVDMFRALPECSPWQEEAKKQVEAGDYAGANAKLNDEELAAELDRMLLESESLDRDQDQDRQRLQARFGELACEYIIKAHLQALLHQQPDWLARACGYYEAALKANRSVENVFKYACFLHEQKQFDRAATFYSEAFAVYRTLAIKNPWAYQARAATTLYRLGNLQCDQRELKKGKVSYIESLRLYRSLAYKNPEVYNPDVVVMLNCLGALQSSQGELKKAEENFTEALRLSRSLASKNPEAYGPNVAIELSNLGVLLGNKGDLKRAEDCYAEALSLYRSLADKNPAEYLPNVATTQNNLGILYCFKCELKKAKACYTEALRLYRSASDNNPEAYSADVAMTLSNLGALLAEMGELEDAEASYTEALSLRRTLADKKAVENLILLVNMLYNMVVFYTDSMPNKERAIELADEAYTILLPLCDSDPHVQRYVGKVISLLRQLGY